MARLAGCEPASVIVEILNEDGTMARRPQLEVFAKEHGLKIGTIADLIRYRLEKERSVECIYEQIVATEFGAFRMCTYEDHVNRTVHLALIRGEVKGAKPPLVRVHLKDTLRDVIGIGGEKLGWPLRAAMARIALEDNGVIVLLRQEESPRELMEAVQDLKSGGHAYRAVGAKVLRTYGIGAQILRDLGVTRMRVLSAPKQMHGLSGFDLEVIEYVDR
jgi:3,4-dihydroxy 2-butanone 4-phosphate synthase/GTP cyclohydrolase II